MATLCLVQNDKIGIYWWGKGLRRGLRNIYNQQEEHNLKHATILNGGLPVQI